MPLQSALSASPYRSRCWPSLSRPKSLPVLRSVDERLDHLGILEIAAKLIQLRQPEIVTSVVRVRRIVGIAPQITKELHQHERAIEFLSVERGVLGYASQR